METHNQNKSSKKMFYKKGFCIEDNIKTRGTYPTLFVCDLNEIKIRQRHIFIINYLRNSLL